MSATCFDVNKNKECKRWRQDSACVLCDPALCSGIQHSVVHWPLLELSLKGAYIMYPYLELHYNRVLSHSTPSSVGGWYAWTRACRYGIRVGRVWDGSFAPASLILLVMNSILRAVYWLTFCFQSNWLRERIPLHRLWGATMHMGRPEDCCCGCFGHTTTRDNTWY